MITTFFAFYINVTYRFFKAIVRKESFPSENLIISIVIHLTIKNLTDCIKLIVTIKLKLSRSIITGLQVVLNEYALRIVNSLHLSLI